MTLLEELEALAAALDAAAVEYALVGGLAVAAQDAVDIQSLMDLDR